MPRLELTLLGPFQARRDGEPVAGFAYDKVRALLAYLAAERERPHRREALAALLWPDQDERAARHSLSQALWSLRRALDDRDADPPLLLVTSDTVGLNPAAGLWSDLTAFDALLAACERHPHRAAGHCRACARRLNEAVALYQGDLLEGFSLPDSVLFDEWLLVRRERAREQALAALDRLAGFLEARGELEGALVHARRALALDPWREETARQAIRLLAWTGQRPAAIEQFERFRERLACELGVAPEAETLALVERVRHGRARPPARRDPAERLRLIPDALTGFVGRERELAELSRLLLDGGCRLVTLTGPGGVGKTRLACEAARVDGAAYADGVAVVPLAGLSSADLLSSAIGGALGAPLQGSHDERESLLRWLADRELLLVLDNFEHLLDGADFVAELLLRAPDLQLLVTSRERLDLHGEWVVEVGGLALPDGASDEGESSAERLFTQRARQARAGFAPDAGERAAIARLCRLVEGLPLAIEIAAGWAGALSCAEIVAEVERGLDFLATTRRDVEPRHGSVAAVFDHSWRLLSEEERRVFSQLSVFRGGFERGAAEAVAGATLAQLAALVGKSLLRRTATGRYELHELPRQYAAGRLAERPDWATARTRHCLHYTGLLERRASDLRGERQAETLAELEAELENLRAAWNAAVEDGQAEALSGAVYGLWLFSEITGRSREQQEQMRRGAEVLSGGAIGATSESTEGSGADWRSLALGRTLILLGSTHVRTGEHDEGDALVARGLELLRAVGQPEDVALGLNFRATFAHARLELEREEAFLRESLALVATADDDWVEPYSLNDLGMARLDHGDDAEADRLCRLSLARFRERGDKRGMAFALHNLGVIALRSGAARDAETLLLEALELRRELRHAWGVAVTSIELGVVARALGERALAAERLRAGLTVANEVNSRPAVLRALVEWAGLLASDGERERAVGLLNDIRNAPGADAIARARAEEALRELDARPSADGAPDSATIEREAREILARGAATPVHV